jgi:thiamine pyrophosphate-dependent acetolactate synthase large subunit-like protein
MRAGLAVIEALRAEGVDHTFGVVGSTTNTIVTEMYGRNDIWFVDTRHEEGAAFMAPSRATSRATTSTGTAARRSTSSACSSRSPSYRSRST